MPPDDVTANLRACPVFAMLDNALLAGVAAGSRLLRLGGGNDEFLFRAGDAAEGLFLIAPDKAGTKPGPAVQVSFDGRQAGALKVAYTLFQGEIVGDVEFLVSGLSLPLPPRLASARALKPLQVLHIPATNIDSLLKASEPFRRRLVRDASRRLADLLAQKAAETSVHPEIRLADGLLSLLDDYGHVIANKGVFASRLTQQEIADRLGMSRRLLSMRCSDWSARGLIETAPFGLPDVRRLERIASFMRLAVGEALPHAISEVEEIIARGHLTRASHVATDMLVVFPGNPVFIYLLALAGARMGAGESAGQMLATPAFAWDGSIANIKSRLREAWSRSLDARHLAATGLDEEEADRLRAYLETRIDVLAVDIGALRARLLKDRVNTCADATRRRAVALEAALLYRQVHEARPNHYCAVNAASLYMIGGRREDAGKLAAEADRLAQRDAPGYWASASRGEALLLTGRTAEAAVAFAEAVTRPDADPAKTTATRRQLRLLSQSTALDVASGLKALEPGSPVFFSGPLMTGRDGTPEELRRAEEALTTEITDWLAARHVPVAFSSAACGADILFAERAFEAGIPLHLILPFSVDRFAELSVRVGDGWEARYLRCLDRAESVSELWHHDVPRGSLDHHFLRANRHLAGETIFAAEALGTKPLMLAVLDDRKTASLAGTHHTAGAFAALGHEVLAISSPFRRASRPGETVGPDPFAPVVFAFSRAQSENDDLARQLLRLGFVTRVMKDRRLAGQKVCSDWQEAFTVASLAGRLDLDGEPHARVVCDYGPVVQSNGAVDHDAMLKLEAAFDLTAAVCGDIFATSAFVMAELGAGGDPTRYAQVSVAVEHEGAEIILRGARKVYRI